MKNAFLRILKLIYSPLNEWIKITQDEKDIASVRNHFFFPCLLLVVLSVVFLTIVQKINAYSGVADQMPWIMLVGRQLFLKVTVVFTSVYVSMLMLNVLVNSYLKMFHEGGSQSSDFGLMHSYMLVVYPSSIIWLLDFVLSLFPSLFVLKVCYFFYTLYVIWCALIVLLPVCSNNIKRSVLSVAISLIIFLIPWMVQKGIDFLANLH